MLRRGRPSDVYSAVLRFGDERRRHGVVGQDIQRFARGDGLIQYRRIAMDVFERSGHEAQIYPLRAVGKQLGNALQDPQGDRVQLASRPRAKAEKRKGARGRGAKRGSVVGEACPARRDRPEGSLLRAQV